MILYHFTCKDHGQPGIDRSGILVPNLHPLLPELGPVVWLTDIGAPSKPEHLGLTHSFLSCDRMAVRYQVKVPNGFSVNWWPIQRMKCQDKVSIADLERYGRPSNWWVSPEHLEVVL